MTMTMFGPARAGVLPALVAVEPAPVP